MKKKYESPEMEVIELSGEDIITSSGGADEGDFPMPTGEGGDGFN